MTLNNIEVDILASVKLIDLYNHIYPENFFIHKNVIYCVHNEVNGKNYIGQTSEFCNRFSHSYVGHFRDYELYLSGNEKKKRALYNSWSKHGLESFVVYILEVCDSRDSLNEREMYWIKTLHTCTKDSECFGYNLTWGADDIGFLKEGAIQKSLQSRLEKYGSYVPPSCYTPGAFEKGNKTKEARYGHGGFINAFTPEANEKRIKTNLERYGNKSGFQRDKFLKFQEENLKKYGDPRGNPESYERGRVNRRVTLCFQKIEKVLGLEKGINSFERYFELIPEIYDVKNPHYYSGTIRSHLEIIQDLLSLLRRDNRWTSQMELIFGDSQDILKDKSEYFMKKRKIKNQNMSKNGSLTSSTKILKSISKVADVNSSLTWEGYKKLAFQKLSDKYVAKVHLNRLIDVLPHLKSHKEWTLEHERVFGSLTDKDKI